VRILSDAWREKEDEARIKHRLNDRGVVKGRVLYYIARPALSGGASLQREAAALISLRRHAVLVYRVCFRERMVREDRIWAFAYLCGAAYRLARELGKPLQVYLEPGIDAARIEERLRDFKRAPKNALKRVQRENDGVWLQRDP
jgi:hypothetical protein